MGEWTSAADLLDRAEEEETDRAAAILARPQEEEIAVGDDLFGCRIGLCGREFETEHGRNVHEARSHGRPTAAEIRGADRDVDGAAVVGHLVSEAEASVRLDGETQAVEPGGIPMQMVELRVIARLYVAVDLETLQALGAALIRGGAGGEVEVLA